MLNKLVINPKPPKGEDGYRTFSVRIKSEIVGKLDRLSSVTGRSRNELIGIMINFALENCGVKEVGGDSKKKIV